MGLVPILLIAFLTSAIAFCAAAQEEPALDREVLTGINQARTDPAAPARELQACRQLYRGRVVHDPQEFGDRLTAEGVSAVDEAIAFLKRQRPLPPLIPFAPLAEAAADQVRDQGPRGLVGHLSANGATPADRVRRHGPMRGVVAETISYGEVSAQGVVRAFVIDDGVRNRGHRADLFDPGLHYAGVACGAHRVYRAMCVVDFSGPA